MYEIYNSISYKVKIWQSSRFCPSNTIFFGVDHLNLNLDDDILHHLEVEIQD
jgi:hypothetical protein